MISHRHSGWGLIIGVAIAALFGGGKCPLPQASSFELPSLLKSLGVTGDGKADDTEALQKAIDQRTGAASFGVLRLPRGKYRITKPLVVDLDKVGVTAIESDGTARIIMDGPGPAIRFLGTHEGTASPKTVKDNVWENQRTPMVTGVEIVGAHADANGIEASGTMQLTLSRVVIRQCRHGIHLVKRNRNVLITGCHIYQNRGIGVYYDHVNLHQSNIVGCHISYCDGGGVVSRGGDVRNIQIGTCDIEGNMSADGPSTANVLLDSTGGSVGEVAITGCTIQHSDFNKDGANIRIIGGGDGGKKLGPTQEGHVTISGNVFSDVQTNVDIQNARGVVITGNTFWMGYQWNLRVEKSRQIVVGPNAFERNPRYNYGTSLETKNAILFRECADCTLTGFNLHHVWKTEAALTIDRCNRMNITNLSILDCECIGLWFKNSTNCRISDCLIRNDLPAEKPWTSLLAISGKGNMIVNNLLGNQSEIAATVGFVRGNEKSE